MTSLRRLASLTCAGLATAALVGTSTLGAANATALPTASPAAWSAAGSGAARVDTAGLPGLSRLLASGTETGRAIVRLDSVPTTSQVDALEALGLKVDPMDALPLAVVEGPVAAMTRVVTSGVGLDVYPDEVLRYEDTTSSNAVSSSTKAAEGLRSRGLTGQGVTVGVIDSGCDATHPDLADHVVHNVTLVSPEYVNAGTDPTIEVPVSDTPYDNTDLGSGHGTHVAGIIAADGTESPDQLGVAPDADLACFAIGAVITTTAVVTAFDYILDQPDLLGIDVINNSWGNSFRQYDPLDPVNVATKAVAKRGVVVVFAAGNSGSGDAEASVSPFNQAPWVISVAAGSVDRVRGDFSSNGLLFDNGTARPIGDDGHTVFRGDRVGLTQPDIMAPGVDISSSCDSTGTVIGPCPDHGNTSASGTSMASPHIAGAAAVLKQANKRLTARQVIDALKATASPVLADGKRLNSYQVGYGHVNLDRAVSLVRGKQGQRLSTAIHRAFARATKRLQRQDPWVVLRSDQWQSDADPVTLGGSYTAQHDVRVGRRADALKVVLVYPTPGTAANLARYTATVFDADGREVGATTTDVGYAHGTATALLKGLAPGRYTIEVTGDYSVSDPDTIDSDSVNGRVVFLDATSVRRR
ncbi:S8 family serine peptidase [Nocardioides acrostichi]|uniref:S8 family serine peptidase n=1 Tax=Nocardioides acrostichi TaxID=2784339 RepID=A0A930UW28_9ACTN|nr:S8 family serine peptidase [Nocardioides acrostichi]MBF4161923.1 S8 family serine peptidase [Nocardioides acrostichi]